MKTVTFKTIFTLIAVVVFASQSLAQIMVNTRIDVRGSRYSDQMWVFAVPQCTRGFDNGWDAFKMFSPSTVVPTIFAQEETGNFQIDAVPTMNDTYISFKAGEDSVYTFTFNNEYIETMYKELFLIDSVANTKVNIFANGTKYTFNVKPTAVPVKRFKIVATPLDPVVPPVDTVVTPPTDTTVVTPPGDGGVTPPDTVVSPTDSIVDPVDPSQDPSDDVIPSSIENVELKCSKKNLFIENKTKISGRIMIFNAISGIMVANEEIKKSGATRISVDFPKGAYVVNVSIGADKMSRNMIF